MHAGISSTHSLSWAGELNRLLCVENSTGLYTCIEKGGSDSQGMWVTPPLAKVNTQLRKRSQTLATPARQIQERNESGNPFTATACNISGLKSANIHGCRQDIWRSYNKPTFNSVHFDRNPLTCSCKGREREKKRLIDFKLFWHFYWSFSECRRRKHGSERVKGPIDIRVRQSSVISLTLLQALLALLQDA